MAGEEGFDIVLAVTGNGNTVLGLFNGMATTRDACTFQMAPELVNHVIGDISWRRSTPHQVIGFTLERIVGGFTTPRSCSRMITAPPGARWDRRYRPPCCR